MTTAKIETLTEVQIYLVFGRDSLRLSLGALVLATVSRGRLGLGAGLLGRLTPSWALASAVRVAFRSSSLAA